MSMRNVRKIFGTTTTLPPLEGNSDEDFEPLYTKETKTKFTFEGLVLSSHSESDQDVPGTESTVQEQNKAKNKKKKNKKKRRHSKQTDAEGNVVELALSSHSESEQEEKKKQVQEKPKMKKRNKKKQRRPKPTDVDGYGAEMDEIDISVMEVNAILGAPAAASTSNATEKIYNPRKALLSVQSRHLDYRNELKRLFGTESLDDSGPGKKYRPHNVFKYKRASIVPVLENKQFNSNGLNMSLLKREDGCSYFTFNHNRQYQKMHRFFLRMNSELMVLEESRRNMHVESLLESANYMFGIEEYTAANNFLELAISYMHYIAHPYFNLTDQSIRLEYKYMENRPFFIVVLKYLHMLTNRACHRTALELAKLLLNLDPSDPLAMIYIVDVIALRAREHKWLVDVIEYWKKERDANYLYNIQYSYALAKFHLVLKNKDKDYTEVDKLLQEAMLLYPTMAVRILEGCKQDGVQHIKSHPFFDVAAENKYPEKVRLSMQLYAKLVCGKWREADVMPWFIRNAGELIEKLANDPATKERGREKTLLRYQVLAGCPDEIYRHMLVVRPMANLIVEWELNLPNLSRQSAWDPLPPPDGINRYGYGQPPDPNNYSGVVTLFAISRYPLHVLAELGMMFEEADSSSCSDDAYFTVVGSRTAAAQRRATVIDETIARLECHFDSLCELSDDE